MAHARIAFIKFQPGTADQAIQRAKSELYASLREQPGFASYSIVKTGPDIAISLSRWGSRQQAEVATERIDTWVRQSGVTPTSVENHVGEVVFSNWDQSASAGI